MKIAIVNLSCIVSGDWRNPFVDGDTILVDDGIIQSVGTASAKEVESCDVIIDADNTTAIPGLIDSQVHNTFGDYTPRQKTVGFLESYLHGGVTTGIGASEVHVPGRPKDPAGVKALALAAQRCFQNYRPGGFRMHAGAVLLEPGLTDSDFAELAAEGVWLAKAGFGAFESPFDYAPLVKSARKHGMITLVHTGGASIPGSSGIWADHLFAMQPHVSFHVNGGPVAMPDEDFGRLVEQSDIALQLCTAGNLRTALMLSDMVKDTDNFDRLLIATDTPTGSGIMPLGMQYTITHLASLGGIAPEVAIAAATGNNANVYGINCGFLSEGKDADIVLIDACSGGTKETGLSALANGDIAAVSAVISGGVPRFVGRSRNTPAGIKNVRVAHSSIQNVFEGNSH